MKPEADPASGLSAARAAELLAANGRNELPEEPPEPGWRRFLAQYTSYMQLILLAAAIVSLVIKEWTTAVVLIAITVLNAAVSLRQQGKAESAMNALKAMVRMTARVRRDGEDAEIATEEIVVGDIVLLAAGDEVPADGELLAATALQIDESALTGESVPVAKGVGDSAFAHTPVTHGGGVMAVTATGADSEVGKIAGMLSRTKVDKTPLTRQLDTLTLYIAGAAGITMLCMFVLGIQRDQSATALFTSAVALAIAAIPEALPTVLQVVLSLGAGDLAKRGAIVKDLTSVETLGSTSAINSDKTGTLTMNQMTAVEVVNAEDRYTISGSGYELTGQVHHAAGSAPSIDDAILPYVVASDAKLVGDEVVGDPTEGALLVLGHKAGLDIEGTRLRYPRVATLPFDPTYKLMAAFTDLGDGRVRAFVKGAAPAVMSHATTPMPGADAHIDRMAADGLRVMAAGYRDLDPGVFDPEGDLLGYVDGLELSSLVGMVDPPRLESKQAVADAQSAHIRVRMITGDDVTTGAAIAQQLGIEGQAILGADFAALSEEERIARVDDIGVIGRVAPEHKVLLVDTLRAKGDVVAMTGDGVNDAPAIKDADIGIAMGSGTEVAKNASRMILSDDNFATIVGAVEQGRKLYDNLAKYVRFVMITLVAFVLTFLGATLLNIAAGQPFSSPQVLWIHFFVSAPFGIALGLDQQSPGLMARRPRPRSESIVSRELLTIAGLVGLYMAIANDALIHFGIAEFDSAAVGSSIGLTAFSLMIVMSAYEVRSVKQTVFRHETFDNRTLNLFALGEIALAVLATQTDVFNRLLGTVPLTGPQFLIAVAAALVMLGGWGLGKLTVRRR